ncbi:MAG TPA: SLBB domain-containing protein [Dehalococcoidia bacterium]
MLDALERYRWLVVAVLAIPLLVGIGVLLGKRLESPGALTIQSGQLAPGNVSVYVTGAVQNPGVYPLADGSRWIDGLAAAGGATAEADLTAVNLSKRAQDEDEIIVPQKGQQTAAAVAGAAQSPGPLVDLNTATEAQLEALPGIGAVHAGKIIQSRTTDGPFTQVEDLVLRKLVTASMFQSISAMITVN